MLKAKSVTCISMMAFVNMTQVCFNIEMERKEECKINYGGMDKLEFCCGEMSAKHSFCLAGQVEQPVSLFYVMYQFSP